MKKDGTIRIKDTKLPNKYHSQSKLTSHGSQDNVAGQSEPTFLFRNGGSSVGY